MEQQIYDLQQRVEELERQVKKLSLNLPVIKSVCDCEQAEYYFMGRRYFKCKKCGKEMN